MRDFPPTQALELDFDKGWLTIWFNQPDSRNALSAELTAELRAVLQDVRDDRSVRGITLRGRGGVFCAGGDLKAFQSGHQSGASDDPVEGVVALSKSGAEIFDLVDTMPQVVIASIEGAAMAGGLGLACCADVVLVESGARFAFTETAIGLTPAQIAPFVVRKLGYSTGRRLMLTAARFDGSGAEALGLADFVAEGVEALDDIETGIRRQVLKCAPGAVADIKRLILDLPTLDREAQIEAAARNFAGRLLGEEGREGIASFLEKRKPRWAEEG
ncbi:enoyl-CoA hydratase-related protein [Maricaulis sp.]|uniref:enoyl-CoA hydratase/isomerase family protein n=1 Tax=Maricaulis sp. TaxID=1486257 RepID=UPI00263488DF|nr:enoyl-CoA hydratase-related protein [Maricaulis sp.]